MKKIKYINYIFLFIFTILQYAAFSQVESTPTLVGKVFVTQTGGGAGYWQVTGNFTDESGFYDGSTIGIGTVLFFNDAGIGYYLPVTNVVSLTPPSFTVQVNNTGIIGIVGIPTTTGSMFNPSPTLKLPFFTSGLSNADQQLLLNYLVNRIESQLATADEIAFVSGTGIPATTVATVLGYKLAKNNGGDGDLYEWDGTQWVLNQRSASLIYDFENTATIALNAVGTTVSADLRTDIIDSTHVKDNSIPLDKISQSNATIGQAPVWDGTKWTAQNIAGSIKIDVVRDSAEMRNYNGTGEVLFMTNNAKGGYFKPCTVCTADQYMIFTDALTRKWERFGYEDVMASWFMSTPNDTLNHLDLQRGLDYVMSKTPANRVDQTKGTLWLNRNARLKNTVTRPEGGVLRGYSPARAVRSNLALEPPPSNIIYVDLNDPTKTAFDTEENNRGYEVAGGLSDLVFYVVSRCSVVINIREPYRSHIDHIFIASDSISTFNSRNFDYGLAVKGSVYTVADGIYIAGARKAGIYGYAGDPCVDFGGGTFLIKNSSVIRSKIGIQSQRRDSICSGSPSNTYQVFELDNFVLENIDSIGAYIESNVTWTNSYAENTPIDSLGYFMYITPKGAQEGSYVLHNVSPNAAATCDSCKVFNRGARYLEFSGAFVNNYSTLIDSVYTNDNVIFNNIRYLGADFPLRNLDKSNVKAEMVYAYTGSGVATSTNWLNQTYRIKSLQDQTGNTGTPGQYLKSTTGANWTWANIQPSEIAQGGATNGQALVWNGTAYVPTTVSGGSVTLPNQQVGYGNGSSITSKTNFQFNPTTNTLGINAGATPQAAVHVVANGAFEKALIATNSVGTQGFEVNRDGNFGPFGSSANNASITAGLSGGLNLNAGVLNIAGGGTEIRYKTTYGGGHSFQYFTPNTATTGEQKALEGFLNFSPSSGNARAWAFKVGGAINQTGTASGETGGVLIPLTFPQTAPNFKAIKIEPIRGYGIHQSANDLLNPGATIRNAFMANTGIGDSLPDVRLVINSGIARTNPILKFQNANDTIRVFATNSSPNTLISAKVGSTAFATDGTLWQKFNGTGNTGWGQFYNLGLSHGATTGQVMKYNGTIWAPANDLNTIYIGGTGIDITGTVISNTGTASTTPNTPAGNIAGTTVQTALNEVDAEKNVNIQFQEDGTNLGTPGNVSVVNFVGSNVTATRAGNTVDVTVTGGGSSNTFNDSQTLDFTTTGSDVTADVKPASIDSVHIKDGGVRLRELNQSGATTGQAPVWNGTIYTPTSVDTNPTDDITGTLTSGQVPYATGTNTVSSVSNFAWNNILRRLTITGLGTQTSADTIGSFRMLNASGEQTFFVRDNYGFNAGRSLSYSETGNNSTTGTSTLLSNKQSFNIVAGNSTMSMTNGSIITINPANTPAIRLFPSASTAVSIPGTFNPSYTLHVSGTAGVIGTTAGDGVVSFTVANSSNQTSAWATNNGQFHMGSNSGNRWSFSNSGVSYTNGASVQPFTFTSGSISFPFSNIGIGTSSLLTSILTLRQGSATISPLRFTLAGAARLTTPVAGSVEADSTRLYYTNSSAVRKSIAHLDDITATTFSNTGTANGLTVTNGAINLNAATYTNPGAVNTGSQTFGGTKTFRTDAEGGSINAVISNHLVTEDGEYVSIAYSNAALQLGEESVRFKGTNSSAKEEYVRSNGSFVIMSNLNGQTKTIETYGWKLEGGLQISGGSTLNASSTVNRDGKYIFAGAGSILELPEPTTVAVGTSFEWVVTFLAGTEAKIQNVAAGTNANFLGAGGSAATSSFTLPNGRASGKVTCMTFSGSPYWYITIYN